MRKPRPAQWELELKAKFRRNELRPLPFLEARWFKNSPFARQYPAITDTGMITYTQNVEKGQLRLRTKTRVGRYMRRLHGAGTITDRQLKHWRERIRAMLPGLPYQIAMTSDEIEWVYQHGPNSCMKKPLDSFYAGIHPVRAYGAGDLGIAYLLNPNNPERVSCRCIVWPAKKIYAKGYGECDQLFRALMNDGYKCDSDGFYGAKLLAIRLGTRGESKSFSLPYMDIPSGLALSPCEKYFTIVSDNGEADVWATSADGETWFHVKEECGHCGEMSGDITAVYNGDSGEIVPICNDCDINYCADCFSCGAQYLDGSSCRCESDEEESDEDESEVNDA